MFRTALYASLALSCIASPALAMAAIPGDPGGARHLATGLVSIGAFALLAIAFAIVIRPIAATLCALGAVAVLIFVTGPSLAAEVATVGDTAVILPWGQWLVAIAQTATEILIPIVLAALGIAARKLPWFIGMWFTTQRIDRMVRLAADYALNAVSGAAAGKALSVDVGYPVLKVALERALGSSPSWLIEAAGGTKGITERLFRAFNFDETVTDANTLTPLLRDLGVPGVR